MAVVALTFAAVFVVELPDKTFIATLVLSTRYRPVQVWAGVGLAFAAQTAIAVALGKAAALLPGELVRGAAVVLFLLGAVVLLRTALSSGEQDQAAGGKQPGAAGQVSWMRAVAASFVVLFAAEWGDLSQLLTLSLAARYDDPVAVFIGAWGALLTVSGLAVIAGRVLVGYLPLRLLHYAGAAVCLLLAGVTVFELG
jgi:Ca2+/H+ antiporter, TMEM165/GDT1 family